MDGILFQACVYLAAAVIAVPLASRLGLGSVLGYLIAGVVIGPVLGLVGSETQELQHVAEFGVVMMLFLVGLELDPRALWEMRGKLLGLGGLQVLLTILAVAAIAIALGQRWSVALAVGMVLALSSTAIVLQTLDEKGFMKSTGGESSFSVLLFQDIAVIPILALIPLLALPDLAGSHTSADAHHGMSLVDGLPGWQVALVTIAAVGLVIVGGHFLVRPVFRAIAATRLREMFTAAALLLVIGIALLMTLVGLSPALGTFLAGVVLASSEYRHELESDIEPFKGLLLGLFFITVGAGINFQLLFENLVTVLALTAGLILIKVAVLWVLAVVFKVRGADRWLFALGLAQAGEFGFVLLSFTVQNSVIPVPLAQLLLLVVALSMLLTPLLFILYEKVLIPRFDRDQARTEDDIDEPGTVIIAGLGRFGQIINRLLLSTGHKTVVLDHRAEHIDGMRKFGVRSFYGDASRPDLLHTAGLEQAKLFVVAIDDKEQSLEIIRHAKRVAPNCHIIARAHDRHHVYALYAAGADDIVRETFDSSLRAARYALEALGEHPYEAEKSATVFVEQDRMALRELAQLWDPDIPTTENQAYIDRLKEINARTEEAMLGATDDTRDRISRGWSRPDYNGTSQ